MKYYIPVKTYHVGHQQMMTYICNWHILAFVCTLHYPHYHHFADVFGGVELLKCLSGTIRRMCYIWGSAYSAYPSLILIVRIHVLYLIIIIKSDVWPICHCLGLGQNNGMCRMSFFIFMCWHILMYNSISYCTRNHVYYLHWYQMTS